MQPIIWKDLWAISPTDPLGWQPFRDGVDILPLYHNEHSECACALLRYHPNAQVPEHEHIGMEHLLILMGSQQDERGVYTAGTLVINPTHTQHSVQSPDGCIVLAIWEKPVRFTAKGDL